MSLILEALKKAERQHRMGEVPKLGTAYHDERRSRSRTISIVLIVVMGIGMLMLGIYLGEGDSVPQQAVVDTPVERPSPLDDEPPVTESSPGRAVMSDANEIREAPNTLTPEKQPVIQLDNPDLGAGLKPFDREEKPETSVVVQKQISRPNVPPQETKSINQLPEGFIEQLPKLNIDIHSYDQRRERSYVLINMEKYREGDYLAEGPLLSEILEDGVVLEHMGERFILPIGNY